VVGEFAVHLALAQGSKCFYTTPIKALSNQKYADLTARHGADTVGLLTGDTSINGGASVVVMTTEVLRNMIYARSSTLDGLAYVVMDEIHYLADRFRGAVWEEVILNLPDSVRLVGLSATVSNAEEFGEWLVDVRGDTAVVVDEHRPVPLWQHMMVGSRMFDLFADNTTDGLTVDPQLVRRVQEVERRSGWDRPRHGGPRFRPPARVDVVARLDRDGLLPAITFIFSRAGCEAAVNQCVRGGLRLTTPEESEQIRRVVVSDALVDTGATLLSLPTRIIRQLGLAERYKKRVTSSGGVTDAGVYEAVRLTIQGRDCTMDVMEVPDTVPVLIGQLPLEHLDLVIDPRNRQLIGNPAHGGEHIYELY